MTEAGGDRPAEEGAERQWERREERSDPRLRRAPGRLEHEPGTATVARTLPMSEIAFAAIRTSNGNRRVMPSGFPPV
jgi:hypothetical protein